MVIMVITLLTLAITLLSLDTTALPLGIALLSRSRPCLLAAFALLPMDTAMLYLVVALLIMVTSLLTRGLRPATPVHSPHHHFGGANNKNERARTFHAWNWALSTY